MQKVRPGIEPGTFCVLDRCDNHYTTEPTMHMQTRSRDTCMKLKNNQFWGKMILGYLYFFIVMQVLCEHTFFSSVGSVV